MFIGLKIKNDKAKPTAGYSNLYSTLPCDV